MTIYRKILMVLGVIIAPGLLFLINHALSSGEIVPPKKINIQSLSGSLLSVIPEFTEWDLLRKLDEGDDTLDNFNLSIELFSKPYFEDRYSYDADTNSRKHMRQVERQTQEREIALKLLNTETGWLEYLKAFIKVEPEGVSVQTPPGYEIKIVERPSGIKWNYWNTEYDVVVPENTVVIENIFPNKENGQINNIDYVPYNAYLHNDEFISIGKNHINESVDEAFKLLKERGVYSRAFPDRLVSDVPFIPKDFFKRLPLLEHSDFTEFQLDPQTTLERILIIIGANQNNAYAPTCNGVSACGWIQFTPGTYGNIRSSYPKAKLMADFKDGAADHVNSIMAAILLYDYNLASLVIEFGDKVIQNKDLTEEYLAASYNGSPKWVISSLIKYFSGRYGHEWAIDLRKETEGFMTKLRYIRESGII